MIVPGARDFLRLYKQQFWLFGWDVRRPAGNLLMELGFTRTPVPVGQVVKSSRYHRALEDGSMLTLWSFGACLYRSGGGGVYVSRLDPRPRYSPTCAMVPDAWHHDQLTMFHRPRTPEEEMICSEQLADLLQWFGDYEAAVVQMCGQQYRQEAIDAWRDPFGTATELSDRWVESVTLFRNQHPLLAS